MRGCWGSGFGRGFEGSCWDFLRFLLRDVELVGVRIELETL